jgi:hypothetical protein
MLPDKDGDFVKQVVVMEITDKKLSYDQELHDAECNLEADEKLA